MEWQCHAQWAQGSLQAQRASCTICPPPREQIGNVTAREQISMIGRVGEGVGLSLFLPDFPATYNQQGCGRGSTHTHTHTFTHEKHEKGDTKRETRGQQK